MMEPPMGGYLVVMREPQAASALQVYRGVCRMPPYTLPPEPPEFPEEIEALDAYVFGEYRDENCCDLIPQRPRARESLAKFNGSRREYEIIVGCGDPNLGP